MERRRIRAGRVIVARFSVTRSGLILTAFKSPDLKNAKVIFLNAEPGCSSNARGNYEICQRYLTSQQITRVDEGLSSRGGKAFKMVDTNNDAYRCFICSRAV